MSVAYAVVRHAGRSFVNQRFCCSGKPEGSGGALTVTDSRLEAPLMVLVATPQVVLVLQRNTFAVPAGPNGWAVALTQGVDPSGIVLAGPDRNTFTGSGSSRALLLYEAWVPAGKQWTVSSEGGAVLLAASGPSPYVPYDGAGVNIGGAVTVLPGTVLKAAPGFTSLRVPDGGSLAVTGSSGSPVTFTSAGDDSAGGDTNGDGVSAGGGHNAAVELEGGSVSVAHAVVRHAGRSFVNQRFCCGDSPMGSGGALTVTDSLIEAPLAVLVASPQVVLVLQRNTFAVPAEPNGWAMALMHAVDVSGVVLAGPDRNTFTGSGPSRAVLVHEAWVPGGKQWTVSSEGGAVILAAVGPSRFAPYDGAGVNVTGSLTVRPGTVLKAADGFTSIRVDTGGKLQASGTPSTPIVFATVADDSIAGDTNGDGAPEPEERVNAGGGVRFETANHASIAHAVYRHLATAVSVGSLNALRVDGSKFDRNNYSIRVDRTDADSVWGDLPCAPPFTTFVDASGNYFTPYGLPGLSFDPTEYLGLKVPTEYSTLYAAQVELLKSQFDPTVTVGQNYVNWALYSCPVIPVPPFPVFPVTAVPPLLGDPYPSVGGGPEGGGW